VLKVLAGLCLAAGIVVIGGGIANRIEASNVAQGPTADVPAPAVSVDIPPVGAIWFGTSFNTDTLEISGRLAKVGTTAPFSFVAHLPRSMDAKELALRIYLDGKLVGTTGVGEKSSGSGDVWGWSPGPLFEKGTWKYQVTDIGGNVLAVGSIKAV
jgi:hypothetical protein